MRRIGATWHSEPPRIYGRLRERGRYVVTSRRSVAFRIRREYRHDPCRMRFLLAFWLHLSWRRSVLKLAFTQDGKMDAQFQEQLTAELAKGIEFVGKSLEVWEPGQGARCHSGGVTRGHGLKHPRETRLPPHPCATSKYRLQLLEDGFQCKALFHTNPVYRRADGQDPAVGRYSTRHGCGQEAWDLGSDDLPVA